MKLKSYLPLLPLLAAAGLSQAAVVVVGVNDPTTDAAYGADASNSDLVNDGAVTLLNSSFSEAPFFGPGAHNDGAVGGANTTSDITFWLSAEAGDTYTVSYTLDTSVNTLGYDINSIQTIQGWTNSTGFQKNQNYVVEVSMVGSALFTNLATVAYLPFDNTSSTASTKVNITEDVSGILATGVDEIRFIYTVPTVPADLGNQPSPTIREIDVHGIATVVPEPSSSALLGLGALTLILRRKK